MRPTPTRTKSRNTSRSRSNVLKPAARWRISSIVGGDINTHCRPGLEPGPITTGFHCYENRLPPAPNEKPRRMGPGVRRDDVSGQRFAPHITSIAPLTIASSSLRGMRAGADRDGVDGGGGEMRKH